MGGNRGIGGTRAEFKIKIGSCVAAMANNS